MTTRQTMEPQAQGLRLFFSEENTALLAGIMYPKKVRKGECLYWEGDPADYLYYVKKGRIKLTKTSDAGGSLTLYLHHEGDLIGYGDSLAETVYMMSAEALENCELGVIQRKDLEVLLWQHGGLAVEFMRWQGIMHMITQTKFRDLMMFGKPGALCSLLIRLNNSYGEDAKGGRRIGIKINNTEMAEMIGATRESVNRMLSDMKKAGAIDNEDGHILIKDLDYLRETCHCENCPLQVCRV